MADNLEKFDADSEATKDSVVFDVVDDEPEVSGSHPITQSNAPGSLPETRRAIAETVPELPDTKKQSLHYPDVKVATEAFIDACKRLVVEPSTDEMVPELPDADTAGVHVATEVQKIDASPEFQPSSSTNTVPNLRIPPVVDEPEDELENVGFAGLTQVGCSHVVVPEEIIREQADDERVGNAFIRDMNVDLLQS